MANRHRGFTLVELIVALLVLEVGLLGLLATAACVTRLIERGERASRAVMFAADRLERLRTTACASRAGGSEVRYRGGTPVDSIAWRFVDAGNEHWWLVLRTTYVTETNRWRTDSLETEISCRF